ncbi:MAG: O-methyltransferase [Anaerolineae bacterium]|nr:O-methyltransferase [Anaerolineae bacterium]
MNEQTQAQLNAYITALFAPEDDALRWIQAEADKHGLPTINLEAFEGRLLQMLVYLLRAKRIVEIGTLAGYSGVWMARALPDDGKLYTLEKSSKHAQIARSGFQYAGLSDKVEVWEGTALDSLQKLVAKGPFDLVFIDADKANYPAYLEWAAVNLRPGGMVTAHNALWSGRVLHPKTEDDRMVDAFNRALAADPRLESFIIGVGDGLAVGVKK